MTETQDKAERLDALLGSYRVPPPDSALAGRIVESGLRRARLHRRLVRAITGAGLIGIGLAGGLTGVAAVMVVMPAASFSHSEALETAFGAVQADALMTDSGEIQ